MGPDDHAEEGKDLDLVLQVEAACRFVEEEEARLLHERPCDQDFLGSPPLMELIGRNARCPMCNAGR